MAEDEQSHDSRMSFGDHLDELRARIILALIGVGVGTLVCLIFGRYLVAFLQIPLAQVQRHLNVPDSVYMFSPFTGFAIYMKVSLIAGIIVASPWVAYQAWQFVGVGLYSHEKKVVFILAPFSAMMSVLGVAFAYFVMLPISLWFLVYWSVSYPAPGQGFDFIDRLVGVTAQQGGDVNGTDDDASDGDASTQLALSTQPFIIPKLRADPDKPVEGQMWLKLPEREYRTFVDGRVHAMFQPKLKRSVAPLIGIGEYINFALMMMLGIIIGFQLPVAMLVLGWIGAVDPALMTRYRRHAMLVCFIVGALLTPADPLSMVILAVPLYLLFEFGLITMKFAWRQHQRRLAEEPQLDDIF